MGISPDNTDKDHRRSSWVKRRPGLLCRWLLCVCMYVMNVHMYVCVYICMYVHVCVCVYVCITASVNVCIHVPLHIQKEEDTFRSWFSASIVGTRGSDSGHQGCMAGTLPSKAPGHPAPSCFCNGVCGDYM